VARDIGSIDVGAELKQIVKISNVFARRGATLFDFVGLLKKGPNPSWYVLVEFSLTASLCRTGTLQFVFTRPNYGRRIE